MGASLLALAKSIYYTRNCMTVKSVTYVSNVIGMSLGTLCNKITRGTKFIVLSTTADVFVFRSRTSLTFVYRLNLFTNHWRKYKRLSFPLSYSGLKLKVLKPFNTLAVRIVSDLIPVGNASNLWTNRNRTPLLLINIHLKGATFEYQQHQHAQ